MATQGDYGLYIPNNYVWDVQQIQQADVNSPEFKELLIRLYQNINSMCIALNLKESGYYNTLEFVNGQMWFPNPANNSSTPVSPNNTTTKKKHYIPINPAFSGTRIYATATDPVGLTMIPLPYVDVTGSGAANVQLNIDDTYVYITTTANLSNYTICYVVIEYLKT